MIPFVAASGLFLLGVTTWRDPNGRSWLFITLGLIMALDEALERQAKRRPAGSQFKLIRRLLAAVFHRVHHRQRISLNVFDARHQHVVPARVLTQRSGQ